jgi:CRP-like cAMP-binding protein
MELTMFERLLQLPLFQGMTQQEVSDVMSHVRLDFVNYHQGDEIVIQGESCRKLIYIISGEVTAEHHNIDQHFTLTEHLPSLKVIEPYNLFGMYQTYSRTYTFATDGSTLAIDKHVVLSHLMANNIVKINLMNIVCNKYQQTLRLLCNFPDDSVQHKIIKFVLSHSIFPKGKKEVQIKMTDLANNIHETRLNVSIVLNEMEEQGLITMQRGSFTIKNLQEIIRV